MSCSSQQGISALHKRSLSHLDNNHKHKNWLMMLKKKLNQSPVCKHQWSITASLLISCFRWSVVSESDGEAELKHRSLTATTSCVLSVFVRPRSPLFVTQTVCISDYSAFPRWLFFCMKVKRGDFDFFARGIRRGIIKINLTNDLSVFNLSGPSVSFLCRWSLDSLLIIVGHRQPNL